MFRLPTHHPINQTFGSSPEYRASTKEMPKQTNAHKALQNEFGYVWSTTGVKLRGIYFKKILCWFGLAFGVFFANAISNIFQGLQVSSVVSRHVFFFFLSFLAAASWSLFSLKAFFLPGLGWGMSLFSLFFVFFSLKHFPGVVLVGLYHQTEQWEHALEWRAQCSLIHLPRFFTLIMLHASCFI